MTWLILTSELDSSSAAAMHWLAESLSSSQTELVAQAHVMWVTTPSEHAHVLATLPAALGVDAPPAWPQALEPGFHPLRLGRIQLVLCIGTLDDVLPDCVCAASQVWVGVASNGSRLPSLVARLCAAHASLTWHTPLDESAWSTWQAAGFQHVQAPDHSACQATSGTDTCVEAPQQGTLQARYAPRWPVTSGVANAPSHVIVIGAGLAGAATALCLVRAGWQVTLLDQHDAPGKGASGLPVGMLSEHVAARETTLSALSRIGMPLHMRELQAHVPQGSGWQQTEVINLKGTNPENSDDDSKTDGQPLILPAALVRPAALVCAWLGEALSTGKLTTSWSSRVTALQRHTPTTGVAMWQVLGLQGRVLATAPHVVVTAAYGSSDLLAPWVADMSVASPLRPVKGQMTLAPLVGEPMAPHAMRQHGVYVPAYSDTAHPIAHKVWAMGSTYERGQNSVTTTAEAHARNAASLQAMHPSAQDRLTAQAMAGETVEWAEVRCASLDRLPCAGALPAIGNLRPSTALEQVPRVPGLWTVCALGSRGLTLAMLTAQLLVARMMGTPLPVSKRHAVAMDPARFALKNARKPPVKTP